MPSEITARKATLQLEEADAVALEKAVEPTPEEPATPAAPAAVEPKEETIVEDAPPPIAWDVAAIEKQLSDAASDSLHVSADDRATFIAFTLLGQDTSACPRITEKPEEFDTELEDSPNSSRRPSTARQGDPTSRPSSASPPSSFSARRSPSSPNTSTRRRWRH